MDDDSKSTGTSGDKETAPKISNSDVKSHPLFQKLTQELADERKTQNSMKERLSALEKDDNDRKAKQLESKKKYDEAMEKRLDQAKKDARGEWDAEQAKKDKVAEAKLHLVKSGFKNEKFLKGALSDFDPDKHTAEDFTKAMMEDDSNKAFLDAGKGSGRNPDPHPTQRSGSKLLTPAEIQVLRDSGKPEDIAKANDAAEALWVSNEGSTGLPT